MYAKRSVRLDSNGLQHRPDRCSVRHVQGGHGAQDRAELGDEVHGGAGAYTSSSSVMLCVCFRRKGRCVDIFVAGRSKKAVRKTVEQGEPAKEYKIWRMNKK